MAKSKGKEDKKKSDKTAPAKTQKEKKADKLEKRNSKMNEQSLHFSMTHHL